MKKRWLLFIPIFVLLSYGLLIAFDFPGLIWLELKSIDWRFMQRAPIETTGDVVVAAIDERSLHREGHWPWPRTKVARLIERLNDAGASLIEMDIIFAESTENDAALAKAIAEKRNVLTGYFFYQKADEIEAVGISRDIEDHHFESILPSAVPGFLDQTSRLYEMVGVTPNVDILTKNVLNQGFLNVFPDFDGVLRRFPLLVRYRDALFPSIALVTFSHYLEGFDPLLVRDSDGSLEGIMLGPRFIPTNERGEILINYRDSHRKIPVYSATDILAGSLKKGELTGKTVLVGATAFGIYDLRVTPLSPNLPGVLVQAHFLDNLYRGDFLIENIWTYAMSVGVTLLFTICLTLILPRVRILIGVLITIGFIGSYAFIAQSLFDNGYLIMLITPSLVALTLAIVLTIYRGLTEEKEKKMIRQAFQAYLHPEIVKELSENPGKLELGGQNTDCTILFADVRNFTTISEKMSPEKLVKLMNQYFDPVAKAIIKEGGYVDKFIGDAVMAIFGAPHKIEDHALKACRAALAMKKIAHTLVPSFQETFGIEDFHIGIGLHSGSVIVGNMGTRERLNYTVMGDVVNAASRLEEATKRLETEICISEATYMKASPAVEASFIDTILVKGKAEKMRVYKLQRVKEAI